MVRRRSSGRTIWRRRCACAAERARDAGGVGGGDERDAARGRERFEKAFILRRLQETHWNITRAAERLGIERSNLHRK